MKSMKPSREAESRDNGLRIDYNMEYVSPLSLPPGVAKEGYSYYWVSKDVKGMENYEVERLAAKGWTLVSSDRAPSYALDPLKRNPLSSQYLCYKDVILMERPEVYSQQETAKFNALNENKLSSLRRTVDIADDVNVFAKPGRSINSF